MSIGSINQTISLLGATGASARDPFTPVSSRRSAERRTDDNTAQHAKTFEAAFTTRFSQAALERAKGLDDPGEDKTQDLSKEEQEEVQKLKQRDEEVRRHEQAHQGAAGNLASGGASLELTRGPDGQQYAIGGEVQIDASPVSGDPEATIRKMRQVQRAARAPANPSGTDLKVASSAVKQEAAARVELRQEKSRDPEEVAGARAASPSLPVGYRASNDDRSGALLNLIA